MTVAEEIVARRSARAYNGEPLRAADAAALEDFIASTAPPWGVTAHIELVHADLGGEPHKLGTYGVTRGARDFMGLAYREGSLAAVGAAYWFEQVILHCTGLGLATCWLAGFTPSSFLDTVTLGDGEKVQYASPVGYVGGTQPMFVRLGFFNPEKVHNTKKPFGTLFLHDDFATPLTEAEAGPLAEPLRLTRIAPSAKNVQPYRVVVAGGQAHFYTPPSRFGPTDVGIALAHFDLSRRELAIPGRLEVLDDHRTYPGFDYVMSWTA